MTELRPLRLSVGSHQAGSGKGCAMNVISWESGDSTISDMPQCADPMLARIVQKVNDTQCTHRDGDLLCPPCSIEVLTLAHRTVGTALDMKPAERAKVYVEIALEEAESILHLTSSEAPRRTSALIRRWLGSEDISRDQILESREECYAAAADAYAAYAADAAAYAAADAAAYAADAADARRGDSSRLQRAHRIIDRFEQITGVRAQPVATEVTAAAICQMVGA